MDIQGFELENEANILMIDDEDICLYEMGIY